MPIVNLSLIWGVIVNEADYRFDGRANRELAIEKLTVRKAAGPITFWTGVSLLKSQPPFDTLLTNFRNWSAAAASADHLTVSDIEDLLAIFRSVADRCFFSAELRLCVGFSGRRRGRVPAADLRMTDAILLGCSRRISSKRG